MNSVKTAINHIGRSVPIEVNGKTQIPYQAIQYGELNIDIAVIAAPAADPFGNANGLSGPAACGLLGFALADSEYAQQVIVVTDNLVPFPCIPWQIQGNFASMLDVAILGATEVDVSFNGNVVTHSDGYLLHGIGGWQNCLFGKCVILPIPLFRNRIPVIREAVTTLCGPGKLIDVIVTERGIAINPRRKDLLDAVKHSSLPIKPVEELKEIAEKICGKPAEPELCEEIVAVIKWVDGTVIDAVRCVEH